MNIDFHIQYFEFIFIKKKIITNKLLCAGTKLITYEKKTKNERKVK